MTKTSDDGHLSALARLETPQPDAAARQRAVEAALLAFDEAAKSTGAPQGRTRDGRLKSIIHHLKDWTMDTRLGFGLGTAAIALLLLPLGYQLYTTTAISPLPERGLAPAESAVTSALDEAETAPATADAVAPPPAPQIMAESAGSAGKAAPAPGSFAAPMSVVPMRSAEPFLAPPPAAPGDSFTRFDESPVRVTAEAPVSTFSIDVDTASYAYVRRLLGDGFLPEPAAVRIEELLNYFDYAYPPAADPEVPFQPAIEVFPNPWREGTELVRIGLKGHVPPAGVDRPANLTFLIDSSGSMQDADKLPLLRRAFGLLVGQLSENDTVAIVTYAGSAGLVLEPTPASERAKILAALDGLVAGGSTAGAAGIELAYRLAAENRVEGGINRVILATDGDFNVGIEDPEALEDFIKARRDEGISLSVLGFGRGNLGDDTMQALAQNGNGVAAYIDSFREAQKVLAEQLGGTLETIAQDVKIQVEFNPATVAEYRLVGYETRALRREDFNNDSVDAGDVGAGHTVTALYEIVPVGSAGGHVDPLRYGEESPAAGSADADEYGYLKLRYKLPGETASRLIETPIGRDLAVASLAEASDDARWAAAVAAFGQKLKGSDHAGTMGWAEIEALARGARGSDENGWRAEFVQLVGAAAALAPDR